MTKYVANALHELLHPYPKRSQHAPHKWELPDYGAKTQRAKEVISLDILPEHRIKLIQKLVGTFLYYGWAVDPTLLVSLGLIAA